jgi:hypothetical protein
MAYLQRAQASAPGMRLPDFKISPVEARHQQVVPQRRPTQHTRASCAAAQSRAARGSEVSDPGMRTCAVANATHHTRVAMSHTANALSCGEPAARNWPHGLQHSACRRTSQPQRALGARARVMVMQSSLTVADNFRFPDCSVVHLQADGGARPRMPAGEKVREHEATCVRRVAQNARMRPVST